MDRRTRPKIVVGTALHQRAEARLRGHLDVVGLGQLSEAEGLLGIVPDSAMLAEAIALRAIATVSAGFDHFDVDDLTRRGIALLNCPDALTETTADLAFALILATARRVVELANYVAAGRWNGGSDEDGFGVDVHGRTLGVVGLGRIGLAIARRGALGFGMPVLYSGPTPKPEAEESLGALRCSLDDLLAKSDFVCIAAPLRPETLGLIGERQLGLMKPSAILVNIARGKIVDEHALVRALEQGTIRGAGLDVFEVEPLPGESPLAGMPNVVALPHVGSATRPTREAMVELSVQNLLDYLVEGKPHNVVNPDAIPAYTD